MDDRRFDDLTRHLATRRGLIRALVGSAAGGLLAIAGADRADAACRPAGRTCSKDAHCCSELCGEKDATGRRRCVCPPGQEECRGDCLDPATAYQSDPDNCGACGRHCPRTRCQLAACDEGQCGLVPDPNAAAQQRSCDDGDPCTVNDVCTDQGACAGTPVVCTPLDECHLAGSCDHRTGACSDPVAPDGSACGGDRLCCDGGCCPQAGDVCTAAGCCTPEATETTCNGTCGTVTNNCGQAVECPGIPCGPTCCDGSEVCAGESPHQACCATGQEACFTLGDNLASDTVCCGEDKVCTATQLFREYGVGACCPAGREGCVTVTESGSTPFLPQSACCDEGEICGETGFSGIGACCPAGLEACASQFILGYLVGCCAEGLVCKHTLVYGACCPVELEACHTPEGAGCCRDGLVCDYPGILSDTGACCPAGRRACHTNEGTVCCGAGEVCAEVLPGYGIGACCPAGQQACPTPAGEYVCCGAGERCFYTGVSPAICCAEGRVVCTTDNGDTVCCDEGEVCEEMVGELAGFGDCRAAGP